jgi:tetratricopeptide (TPR) repeat protein
LTPNEEAIRARSRARPAPGLPTRRRIWLFRLTAVILGPTLFFGLIELGLYLVGYGYPTTFFRAQARPEGGTTYVENPEFGRRFFPPQLVRSPLTLSVPAVKPPGTYRVFILGESAALGIPNPSTCFGRILEKMLQDRYPGRRFEMINTSITSINSNVILPIARECARHQPDLFIVFMGNNEVVGPFGAAGVLGPFSPNRFLIRANLLAKETRTGQLIDDLFRRFSKARDAPRFWRGMEMFLESRLRPDDPRLRAVHAHFRDNLREICSTLVHAGAKAIVCTVPVNLKDSAPFASLHAPNLTPDVLSQWERIYQEGVRLESAARFAEAESRYDEAARIDDQFADLAYHQARCLMALGRAEEAGRKFSRARDLDALRFRTDSTLNETIRRVVGAQPAGVSLVDAERAFARESPSGIPGEDLFYEHVHMNFHGNYLIARGLFREIAAILPDPDPARPRGASVPDPLPEPECAARLAYTARERWADALKIGEMLQNPPFTNQLDADARAARWEGYRQALKSGLGPEALQDSLTVARKALNTSPDDWMIRMHMAGLLAESDALSEAAGQYEALLKQVPHLSLAHYKLGTVYLRMKDYERANSCFRAALRIAPDFAGAHYGLAEVLAAQGRVKDAIAVYDERVKNDSDRVEALRQKADFLERLGKPRSARTCLEEALRLDPDDALIRVDLGNALTRQGALEPAIAQYEAALRLRPNWREVADHLARLRKIRGK